MVTIGEVIDTVQRWAPEMPPEDVRATVTGYAALDYDVPLDDADADAVTMEPAHGAHILRQVFDPAAHH